MLITTLTSPETSTIPIPTSQLLSSIQFERVTPSVPFSTSLFSQTLTTVLHSTTKPFMFITTLIFSSDSSVIPISTSQLLSSSQLESFTPSFAYTTSRFSQRLTTVVPSTIGPSMFITTLISSVTSVITSPTSQHLSTSFASFTVSFYFNTSPFSQGLTTVVPSTSEPFMFITTLTSPETSTIPTPTSQLLSSSQFESFTPSFSFNTLLFSQGITTVVPSTTKPFMFITTLIFSSDSTAIHLLSSSQFESFNSYTTLLFSQGLTTLVLSITEPFVFISTLISSETSAIPTPTSQLLSSSQFEGFILSFSFSTSLFSQALTTFVPSTSYSEPFMFVTTHISSKTIVISTSMTISFVTTTQLQMTSTLNSDILLSNFTLIPSETPVRSIMPSQTTLLSATLTELEISLPSSSPLPTPTPTHGISEVSRKRSKGPVVIQSQFYSTNCILNSMLVKWE